MPYCSEKDMPKRWNDSMAPQKGLCLKVLFFFSDDDDFLLTSISLNVSCISWQMQVKSIQKQISILSASLNSQDAEAKANAQAEIDKLQQELINVCAGVSIQL